MTRQIWRGALIYAAAFGAILLLLLVAWNILRPLALLFLAIVIGEALAPVVRWLQQWIPRLAAIVLVYLVLLLALGGIGWIVFPPLVDQVQAFVENWPENFNRVQRWLDRLDAPGSDNLIGTATSQLQSLSGSLVSLPLAILSSVVEVFLVIFMSIYWLITVPALHRFTMSLVPERNREQVASTIYHLGRSTGGYIRGAAINAVAVGLLTYVGLLLIGVPFPLVLALIAGLLEFVPVVGPVAATVPIVSVAFTDSIQTGLIALGFWIVMQQVENQLLVPLVMRSQTDIPSLLVIFALSAGSAVSGILGALVAIPIAGALLVLMKEVVAPGVRRWTGAPSPEEPERDQPAEEGEKREHDREVSRQPAS